MAFKDDVGQLFQKSNASQLDFLNIELELCAVFIQTALDARKNGDDERFATAKSNAIRASQSIGRLLHQIPQEAQKASLVTRLSELDLVIDGL
ncbi:MAG TPA: hypothetical protein VGG72_25490 [Bryobacteraceae bacterium]|jgi:hypothetical protein